MNEANQSEAQTINASFAPDKKHVALATFIQLEQESRQAKVLQELFFLIANETKRLLPYHQLVVVDHDVKYKKFELVAISGVPEFERHAPYIRWLQKMIQAVSKLSDRQKAQILTSEHFPEALLEEGKNWFLGAYAWIPCNDRHGRLQGGMLLTKLDNKWEQNEINLIERLSEAYAQAWLGLKQNRKSGFRSFFKFLAQKWVLWTILVMLVFVFMIPVPQSVLAPAEIVAEKPFVVTSPLEGVIKEFYIEPNAYVKEGDKIIRLDDTNLRNKLEIARKSYDIAEADYNRTRQQAFQDEKSKGQVNLLKAQMDEKRAEVDYNKELLSRVEIKAGATGIAIFSNPYDWIGKPVVLGEKIMQIADPDHIEIAISLPVDEAISLEKDAPIKLFLNTNPLEPVDAKLVWASYEAKMMPGAILAYHVKAVFKDLEKPLRIGLKGTAKIFGEETTLFYYLFRRPLSSFRRFFGI
jgi:multidrug resistance efflux pump